MVSFLNSHCDRCRRAGQSALVVDPHKYDYLHCEGIDLEKVRDIVNIWHSQYDCDCTCNACVWYGQEIIIRIATTAQIWPPHLA